MHTQSVSNKHIYTTKLKTFLFNTKFDSLLVWTNAKHLQHWDFIMTALRYQSKFTFETAYL